MSESPAPCVCPAPNRYCRRAGVPMVGRLWELCSGQCPAERPCAPGQSESYRARWDGLTPAAFAPVATVAVTPAPQPPPREGPGTELKKLLAELGFATSETCACEGRAATMDAWGVAGCREHRQEIVAWLQEQAAKQSWLNRIAGAVAAVRQAGINPLDPYGSLLDEAIRRAEAKAAKQ